MTLFFRVFLVVALACLLADVLLLAYKFSGVLSSQPSSVQAWESVLKSVALAAAAGFFGYKILAGWLIMNMSVSLRLERVARDTSVDHLAITLALDKGKTDSVHLKEIKVRVVNLDTDLDNGPVIMDSFKRLPDLPHAAPWQPVLGGPLLAISPSEKAEYATYTTVAKGSPFRIEAVIYGDRWLSKAWNGFLNQWRVSAISLPLPEKAEAKGSSSVNVFPVNLSLFGSSGRRS